MQMVNKVLKNPAVKVEERAVSEDDRIAVAQNLGASGACRVDC